ncbi:PH domain-containing protein [Trichonephila inaurata madagascariensis]|uniref:PH domain-containing protein n=1 Tax=Trichonephila inaurata madagascariensis TaxID=2747483 RepID=A0A8X7CQU2_9ARAC|nr:PH domain-containing protein [Trichonephila inaurata madagascariensis]
MEIPSSDSFINPLRKGHLQKLTGRGWLYSGSWKKRYCVLEGSKFYFYENELYGRTWMNMEELTQRNRQVLPEGHVDKCKNVTQKIRETKSSCFYGIYNQFNTIIHLDMSDKSVLFRTIFVTWFKEKKFVQEE